MKKIVLLALAAGLVTAAPAPATNAKTVTVDISQAGFVPANVTVQAGDFVTWTNKDTVNHQIVCQKCPFTSTVLAPGQSYSYRFTTPGKYATTDPLSKNKAAADVTVTAAPATLTIRAERRAVPYGDTAQVSGTLSTRQANQKVQILAQTCGQTATKVIANVKTSVGGVYTVEMQPTMLTMLQARYGAGDAAFTTAPARVAVRPQVGLARISRVARLHRDRFLIRVVAHESFVGQKVALRRWVGRTHRWMTVRTVPLTNHSAVAHPFRGTIVSSVAFDVRIPRGVRVRAVLPPSQAGTCYAAASSTIISS